MADPSVHRLHLGEQAVAYRLRRARRRTLALRVDHEGVMVSAPEWVALAQVEAFLRRHDAWLVERLARLAGQPRLVVADGASFPLLGRPARLVVSGTARGARWEDGEVVSLTLPHRQAHPQGLERALRARALAWFAPRLAAYCNRLGVACPPLRLSAARTRWGSCSPVSGIRLNWRLIHLRPALIDYVVAHEVAHLVEPNHSPRFWAVVESLYGDWRTARAALRTEGAVLPWC